MPPIVERMKERKLVQWALAYLAGAWLVTQVLDVIEEPWGLSGGFIRGVQLLLVLGLVLTLILAWYHGEQGRQRVSGMELAILTTLLAVGGGVVALLGQPELEDGPVEGAETRASIPSDDRPSVAVLPFRSTRTDEESVAFAAGIHEDVLSQLNRIAGLRSISRTSVQQYRDTEKTIPQIASELGVMALLEATVQRAGDAIRFNVQLINGATDEPLWGDTFNRTYTVAGVFEIQAEIASAITTALRAALTSEERTAIAKAPTEVAEAYTAYLEGRSHDQVALDRAEAEAAVESYEQAVALDPDFGPAWGRLSSARGWLIFSGWAGRHEWPRAVEAANVARRLSPGHPDTRVAVGWIMYRRDGDYAAAAAQFDTALMTEESSDVLYTLAGAQKRLGQWEAGLRSLRRAVELDPLNHMAWNEMQYDAFALGRYGEAARVSSRARALGPPGYPAYANDSLTVLLLRGDTAGVRRFEIVGDTSGYWRSILDSYLAGDFLAVADSLRGRSSRALGRPAAPLAYGHENDVGVAMLFAKAGDWRSARTVADSGAVPLERAREEGARAPSLALDLALLRALSGDPDAMADADRALATAAETLRFWYELYGEGRTAAIHSLFGHTDDSLEHLEACLRDTPSACSAAWLRVDPWWDYLRDDPRFEALLRRYESR